VRSCAALRMTVVVAATLLTAACTASSDNVAPTAASSAATAVAQVQATAEPVATRVAGALTQLAPPDVGRLVGTTMGATIDITTAPPGAPNDQVTQATLSGIDQNGAFGRLDQQARRAFASAGLQLARQAYPRAQLDLTVDDANGGRLLSATYPPGGSPTYQ
jgi:hypothetical protein